MGLFPTESRAVEGLSGDEYEAYKVPSSCAAPGCTKWTDAAHHLFSRGKMGGAYAYVRVPDGSEIGNTVPLCHIHHQQVTDNAVHITYRNGMFFWDGVPLSWQPPMHKRGDIIARLDPASIVPKGHVQGKPACPTCGRTLQTPKADMPESEGEPKKVRRTWAVAVPYTVEENGADTIDALLEAAREEMDEAGLNWGDGHKVKYYILATALGLFVQHADKVLGDA